MTTETIDDADRGSSASDILSRLEHFGVRLGLERIRALLAALDDPQLRIPAVLVSGTNGKGSTSSLLAAMATAAGYKVGLYTSPHLESPAERLRCDGRAIGEEELARHLERALEASRDLRTDPPTYFEALTVAAYLHFVATGVELQVLEVGMGGRLDATNTADPLLAVITSVSFDHEEHLGSTLAAIAREKAGILRAGRPALAWFREPELAMSLRQAAAARGARLSNGRDEVEWSGVAAWTESLALPQAALGLRTARDEYRLRPVLRGSHQLGNIALAVLAAERLAEAGFDRLDRRAIEAGVEACRWPGRLERVELDEGDVILDAAHNLAGAEALYKTLAGGRGRLHLLFGCLHKKPVEKMLPLLAGLAQRVTLTSPPGDRALPVDGLDAFVTGVPVSSEREWQRALDVALADMRSTPGTTLLVCGSLYLVGAVRGELRLRYGKPVAAAELVLGPERQEV